MSDLASPLSYRNTPLVEIAGRALRALESVTLTTLAATPARVFLALTFFLSGRTKVEGFLSVTDSAKYLFQYEYALPIIDPVVAAHLAAYAEHFFPLLLIVGLGTRLAALALLVMTGVIQTFVYPDAWTTHLLWASGLFLLLFRGPGQLSIDHLLRRRYLG